MCFRHRFAFSILNKNIYQSIRNCGVNKHFCFLTTFEILFWFNDFQERFLILPKRSFIPNFEELLRFYRVFSFYIIKLKLVSSRFQFAQIKIGCWLLVVGCWLLRIVRLRLSKPIKNHFFNLPVFLFIGLIKSIVWELLHKFFLRKFRQILNCIFKLTSKNLPRFFQFFQFCRVRFRKNLVVVIFRRNSQFYSFIRKNIFNIVCRNIMRNGSHFHIRVCRLCFAVDIRHRSIDGVIINLNSF